MPVLSDLVLAVRVVRARQRYGVVLESRPGEYGSPVPDLKDVRRRERAIFDAPTSLPGVDLREAAQLALLDRFSTLYEDQPFGSTARPGQRYDPDNEWFGVGAAFVLHAMLRLHRPSRLIEVGSGFSSAVCLDTNDQFLDGTLRCTFIDPFPERLERMLRPADRERAQVLAQPLDQVPLELFDELGEGDVLFIDSSHVSKVGSDVNQLLFEVLPRLHEGVLIHFHDIDYPFEYPRRWIYRGRAWNESYLLRAFLMYNAAFEIELFCSYLDRHHRQKIAATMPLWASKVGTSLWLRKTAVAAPGGSERR